MAGGSYCHQKTYLSNKADINFQIYVVEEQDFSLVMCFLSKNYSYNLYFESQIIIHEYYVCDSSPNHMILRQQS